MTRNQLLAQLHQEYSKMQTENLYRFEDKTAQLCDAIPNLEELLVARHSAVMQGVRFNMTSINKQKNSNAELSNLMHEYNTKIHALLIENGYPSNALEPEYHCSICCDSGYVYNPSKQMCQCLQLALEKRMLETLGLTNNNETFENFDPSVFSTEIVMPPNATQRQFALSWRNACEKYANAYPNTAQRDLLLHGGSGLGKTYLIHAIAHRLVARGYLPTYTNAYTFFSLARRAHMENNPDLLSLFLEAPILLLDDLGTEPLMQNITVTQLFILLNERQLAGLHTVISTNLSFSELRERYTERVTSRLLDSTTVKRMVFLGGDIRKNLHKRGGNT